MKYGQEYKAALASADFPSSWVSAAVSYRTLKKCIKQVQLELHELGLSPEVLKNLDSSFGVHKDTAGGDDDSTFIPELWVAVDGDGNFLHAGLTTSTKRFLRSRANSLSSPPGSPSIGQQNHSTDAKGDVEPPVDAIERSSREGVVWKQIPLTTVTNFFDALEPALEDLQSIQDAESAKLRSQITELGSRIADATSAPPPKKDSKKLKLSVPQKEMQVWRQLFELYTETPIFFSTHERDHGSRPYAKAKERLQVFSDRLLKAGVADKFNSPVSRRAFDRFISINLNILLVLRFEEMNAQAVRKILKKFDKRTSLPASKSFRPASGAKLLLQNGSGGGAGGPTVARSIAHDMCAEIATNVLAVVPSIDDFLCPICCELAWRPVRLGCCNAVFCIRCIIVLQREAERRCPMCREGSVMLADWSRIPRETVDYMRTYFPEEVQLKQIANERAAGLDQYGRHFYRKGCTVM